MRGSDVDVIMPQLGETVTEGTITRWLKQVGDTVRADEPLFEVSTDKVDSEVPAPTAGVLTEIRVPEGETVVVGAVLATIDTQGAPAAAPAAAPPTEVAAPPVEVAAPPAEVAPPPVEVATPPTEVAPASPEPVPATAVTPETAPVPSGVGEGARPAAGDARLTSPVVRRLVAEHGLDPSTLTGSGEGGRVTRKDVMAAIAVLRGAGGAPAPPVPAPVSPAVAEPPVVPAAPAPPVPAPVSPAVAEPPVVPAPAAPRVPAGSVIAFSNIRRLTAEHMVRSLATSAHAYTSVEVDFEAVARVRRAHGETWKAHEGFSLTYLPFIARAVSDTIDDFPIVNASIDGDSLVLHPELHLAVAVDLSFEGLVAPVVRGADGKRLRQLAREVNDLATRARAKRLIPDEIAGGTFTITNPGPYGTYQTLAIINQPQVAILATDGIAKRVVAITDDRGDDVIAVRHTGLLTLGWDHRAFDGAYAAAFLARVRGVLETRDWETELE
ncbi:MAG: hypothetical protein AMXMBFR46_07400 [Acidimicrobiia bacterium]